MKVYEAVVEDCKKSEIRTITQYVTGESLKDVTSILSKEADEIDCDLISVRYVLTIVRQFHGVKE